MSYHEKVRDRKRHRGNLVAGQMKAFAGLSDTASAAGA
jgi:hypothetical protein